MKQLLEEMEPVATPLDREDNLFNGSREDEWYIEILEELRRQFFSKTGSNEEKKQNPISRFFTS